MFFGSDRQKHIISTFTGDPAIRLEAFALNIRLRSRFVAVSLYIQLNPWLAIIVPNICSHCVRICRPGVITVKLLAAAVTVDE